ncbi:cupin-like domain-containing protein [Brevundimonas subvibrioides]|uniref:cupin-like domain-containing protein n=1 Tax=Brevundimonas subvibrioides TaxID=74313 RepID=UPI0032D59020
MTALPQPVAVHTAMDRARFESEIVPLGRPAVLKGLVKDWPAVSAARTSPAALADYLLRHDRGAPVRAFFGAPQMGGRFGYSDDLSGFNHEQRSTTLQALLDQLLDPDTPGDVGHVYAGGVPLPTVLPGVGEAHPMPLLDPGKERLTSLWIGNRSRTAAHWDLAQNLACVVAGRRRFTLFPPDQIGNLYVGPIDRTLAGQPISLVDIVEPDFERHPKYRSALAAAEAVELEPGDVLYLPSLWWHHVELLEDFGAMINLWWRDGPEHMTTPLLTLLHALLTIRDLPPGERRHWRAFFDHYIFQTGDDPVAHIPPAARGVLGPVTGPVQARIKAILLQSLQR